MIRLGNSMAVVGIDKNVTACITAQTGGLEKSGFYDFPSSFIEKPDTSYNSYLYTPLVLTETPTFIAFNSRTLAPEACYNVSGHVGTLSGKVYISLETGKEDFTDEILYETTLDNGQFNFDFAGDELYFLEETVIIIWTKSYNYSSLFSFSAVLNFVGNIQTGITFTGRAAPEEPTGSGHILVVNGTTLNVGRQLNGLLIYDEASLPKEALVIQQNITNGFAKMENGEVLNDEEYAAFYSGLISRTEKTVELSDASSSSYTIEIYQRTEEKEIPVSYFYLWSEHIQSKTVLEREIYINTDSQGKEDIAWRKVCLAGDTLILMADGSSQRLDSLKSGDIVMDVNGTTTKVIHLNRGSFNPYHTLYYFENGIIIDEISRHRFYNQEGGFWKYLNEWKVGEHAISPEEKPIALLGKKRIYEKKENFGLETESGRYYANGLLSGPARCNQKILKDRKIYQLPDMINSISDLQCLGTIGAKEIL